MYNKVKRRLGLVSAILSIVLGGFIICAGMAGLFGGIQLAEAFSIIISCVSIALGVVLIVFGSKQCKYPTQKDGVWEDRKPVYIVLIVLLGISAFLTIFCMVFFWQLETLLYAEGYDTSDIATSAVIHYLAFYIALPALALNIVSMVLKTERKVQEQVLSTPIEQPSLQQEPQLSQENGENFEQKVAQLSNLKESGAITEEQYKKAVDKLISNFVK